MKNIKFNLNEFESLLEGSSLLLDTNFFLRMAVEDKAYTYLLQLLENLQQIPTYITINLVRNEFIRGASNK